MKLGAATDPIAKDIMEDTEAGRGRRSPTLCLAVVAFLMVCVVVGGFVGVFYMFKQNATDHQKMQEDWIMEFLESPRQRQEEIINYSIKEQNNLHTEEKEQEERPRIYHDFGKGLTVFVDDERNVCLLYPPDPKKLEEDMLEKYLAQHPDPDGYNDTGAELIPHDEEMQEPGDLGPTISAMCDGRSIFWLYPAQPEGQDKGEESLSRRKRSGFPVFKGWSSWCCWSGWSGFPVWFPWSGWHGWSGWYPWVSWRPFFKHGHGFRPRFHHGFHGFRGHGHFRGGFHGKHRG